MPYDLIYGTAELSSQVEGSSAVIGTYGMTGDCDSLPQASQPMISNIVIPNVTFLSGHFGYLENDAKVLALSILYITCFIQKHPIRSYPIEQFSPILGAGSIMWHLFQTVFATE